jgi:membrane-associated phospholipid phosphatase
MAGAMLGLLVGLAIFILLERCITPRYMLVTRLDTWIPFISWSWFIYVGFFPFVIALAAYAQPDAFAMFAKAVLVAFVAGIVCFMLFPEAVPRPDVATIGNAFVRQRITRMWHLDLGANGFPSLHVAVTCLACLMLPASRQRAITTVSGVLICASTLTLKQHTIADVSGGVLLAFGCAFWSRRCAVRRKQA